MKAVTLLITTVAMALLTAGMVRAGAPEYRVGPGCTYSTIQAAVDAIPNQGTGIIRIRSGTYTENVNIVGKTVDLLGGHADCTTSSVPGITHIDASGSTSPAIAFLVIGGAAGSSHALTTDKLNLFEGTGNVLAPGGGISMFAGADRTATITLQRTFVRNNQTTYFGGGIALYGDGSGSLALLENSQIENNTVTGDDPYGGGLHCAGDYSVIMIGGSIHGNTAGEAGVSNARGGGIYLDGCDMTWFAQNQTSTSDDAALRNNTVYGGGANLGGFGGGGLFATGGAQVDLIGAHLVFLGDPASSRPLRIHNNLAQATSDSSGIEIGSGSAIFAFGGGTRVRLDRTWTYANEAGSATFYARGGAEIIVERGSEVCHTPRNCSRVFDNIADPAVAFAHGLDNTIRFRRTVVSGNSSGAGPFVSSIFEIQGGTMEIDDSLVFGNSADTGFHILGDSIHTLRVRRSTVAHNDFLQHVFRITRDSTTFTLFDSIVHEPGTTMAFVVNVPTINVDCVVWHDDQLGGGRALVGDPMFADPAAGLFYLQPGSPAINYCDEPPPPPGVDLDWNPRGELHSGQPAVYGPYDLGAYEFPLGIFSDRFED